MSEKKIFFFVSGLVLLMLTEFCIRYEYAEVKMEDGRVIQVLGHHFEPMKCDEKRTVWFRWPGEYWYARTELATTCNPPVNHMYTVKGWGKKQ